MPGQWAAAGVGDAAPRAAAVAAAAAAPAAAALARGRKLLARSVSEGKGKRKIVGDEKAQGRGLERSASAEAGVWRLP